MGWTLWDRFEQLSIGLIGQNLYANEVDRKLLSSFTSSFNSSPSASSSLYCFPLLPSSSSSFSLLPVTSSSLVRPIYFTPSLLGVAPILSAVQRLVWVRATSASDQSLMSFAREQDTWWTTSPVSSFVRRPICQVAPIARIRPAVMGRASVCIRMTSEWAHHRVR